VLALRYSNNQKTKRNKREDEKRSDRRCLAIWAVVADNERKMNGENGEDLLQKRRGSTGAAGEVQRDATFGHAVLCRLDLPWCMVLLLGGGSRKVTTVAVEKGV